MRKVCLWCFCFISSFANPHFFVDVNVDLAPNLIHFEWKFDRINSALLFFEADTNKDKSLDEVEEKAMIEKFFTPLKQEDYFLMIEQDDALHVEPKNIHIFYEKKRFFISFGVALKEFSSGVVCNIDPVTYFAFRLKDFQSSLKTRLQKDRYDFCVGVGE